MRFLKLWFVLFCLELMCITAVDATEPLKDYSFVRGVCYGMEGDQVTIERELGYAKRLQLNSTRIWLNYDSYQRDPDLFLGKLLNYVRTAYKMGISTMPILFNGNMMNPAILDKEFRVQGEAYVEAVVNTLKDEPGLFIWDIMKLMLNKLEVVIQKIMEWITEGKIIKQ